MITYDVANIAPRRKLAHGLHLSRPDAASAPRRVEKAVAPKAEYPEPEIKARTADESEIPRAAGLFLRKLSGIPHRVTYARGWLSDAHGEPSRLVDSIAVRISPIPFLEVTAVASWIDGKSAGCIMRTVDGPRTGNLDDLKRLLGFEVKPRVRNPSKVARLSVVKGGREGMR